MQAVGFLPNLQYTINRIPFCHNRIPVYFYNLLRNRLVIHEQVYGGIRVNLLNIRLVRLFCPYSIRFIFLKIIIFYFNNIIITKAVVYVYFCQKWHLNH